jgi:small subunit ribosomal protein S2
LAAVSIKDLLEAGVHFGHQTKRWNPKMRPFIFEERNGIYILDLTQTVQQIQETCAFLRKLVLAGNDVLFVGTKRQAQEAIRNLCDRTGMPQVTHRWLGGTLTNNQTIRSSVNRLRQIERMESEGVLEKLPKKELSRIRREQTKLTRNLAGIANMERLPAAIFVVDIKREEIAVREARRLKIPVVAIVDTNCDPDMVDYPIAGNDDAIRAIRLILDVIGDAVEEAVALQARRRDAEGERAPVPVPPERTPQPRPPMPSRGAPARRAEQPHVATETVISASPDEPGPALTEKEADERSGAGKEAEPAPSEPTPPPPPPSRSGM